MYFTYILRSVSTGKLYTGHSNNIERRIQEHNLRKDRFTSNKGPWELIYKEEFSDRSSAMKREKFFKSGKGREFVKQDILKGNW